MTNMERYKLWRQNVTDEKLKAQLIVMEDNQTAIDNAFYKDLEFGTGGLRGEIGVGTNCLNIYTIRKATQGIADNMKANGLQTAAISYDSRINSDLFSKTAAEVFAANGIKTYLSKECMPTPFLSFMVRELKADIGVMITASHNPAKYNGYKVYGCDGCQLTDERSNDMISYIDRVDPFAVRTDSLENYIAAELVRYVPERLEQQYLSKVVEQSVGVAAGLKIVYTPLNGAGYRLVPKILKKIGVKTLTIVPEQGMPDGHFTTCGYPNPEKAEALQLGLTLAKEKNADLLIATDPDCDRMGLAVKTPDGYRLLSGNETGTLICDYLFARRTELGTLPKNPIMVKTIVSTDLAVKVAQSYGAETRAVLTGFKYIGELILKLEKAGEESRFVFGYEESYGCLAGSYVRDKDAVVASMLAAEMAAYYKRRGKTLAGRILELYDQYGTYQHKLKSFEFPGAEGFNKMKQLLSGLRKNLPAEIGGINVEKTTDYLTQTEFDLPKSNVLQFDLAGGSQLIIRPSGTEPLIKMYLTAAKTPEENAEVFAALEQYLNLFFG